MQSRFDHPPAQLDFWRRLAGSQVGRQPTPFYLFSITPIETALTELQTHLAHLPVRHWLSCKTQPLRPLLQWWRKQGRPIEVVSEFELRAALAEGFPPERILVNGPAKHRWLPSHTARGLCVNFDSVHEAEALAPLARRLHWTVGLRLNTREECDPESPRFPTQFGLTPPEAKKVKQLFHQNGLEPAIVHFHLRTNVASPVCYERAFLEAARTCRALGLAPRFVDAGGGFPAPRVLRRGGRRMDAGFSLRAMVEVYGRALKLFPGVQELWLENGRWLSARSGVLVVTVLDVKERRGMRHLICDGGRTLNALVSIWEEHELLPVTRRCGAEVLSTVTGPTCMAFDRLARRPLPRSLKPGDHLMWLEAGAYHLPWETRFSHGLAGVLWHDGRSIRAVRSPESFAQWWGQWR